MFPYWLAIAAAMPAYVQQIAGPCVVSASAKSLPDDAGKFAGHEDFHS
jgi:hypothetical protein